MSNLSQIHRPPLSIIKLVEAIGILLRIPQSDKKSIYKAPIPSNYDQTVQLLSSDFNGIMKELSYLESNGIPNDISATLFTKTLEPGFDYEEAFSFGGLDVRELFNLLIHILQQMQKDVCRIPIRTKNILLLFDGSLSSYVALDCLSHIHNHGYFTILSFKDKSRTEPNYNLLSDHTSKDLQRRCEKQYKKAIHEFQIINMEEYHPNNITILEQIKKYIEELDIDIIIYGLDPIKYIDNEFSTAVKSLPEITNKTIVITKSSSKVVPFNCVLMPRKFLVLVKTFEDLDLLFSKAIELLRPIDTLNFACIYESKYPKGDYQDTRFLFGNNINWVKGETKPVPKFNKIGWNEQEIQDMRLRMYNLLASGQIKGEVLMEEESENYTVSQIIFKMVANEQADFIVLRKGKEREVSDPCIRECQCSVVLID